MRAIHCARSGRKGNGRNEVTMTVLAQAVSGEATESGNGGGGTRSSRSSLVCVVAGMTRGRFSGFEKNRKTRAGGKGTRSSNWILGVRRPDPGAGRSSFKKLHRANKVQA